MMTRMCFPTIRPQGAYDDAYNNNHNNEQPAHDFVDYGNNADHIIDDGDAGEVIGNENDEEVIGNENDDTANNGFITDEDQEDEGETFPEENDEGETFPEAEDNLLQELIGNQNEHEGAHAQGAIMEDQGAPYNLRPRAPAHLLATLSRMPWMPHMIGNHTIPRPNSYRKQRISTEHKAQIQTRNSVSPSNLSLHK
jgi:hypothetical protein